MSRTTNRISLEQAAELVTSGARACLAFVADGLPRIEPVLAQYREDRFLAGIGPNSPQPDGEAVLVIDDGVQFFDLRAVYVRGTPVPIDESGAGRSWYEIRPKKVTCWDYGTLRVVDD